MAPSLPAPRPSRRRTPACPRTASMGRLPIFERPLSSWATSAQSGGIRRKRAWHPPSDLLSLPALATARTSSSSTDQGGDSAATGTRSRINLTIGGQQCPALTCSLAPTGFSRWRRTATTTSRSPSALEARSTTESDSRVRHSTTHTSGAHGQLRSDSPSFRGGRVNGHPRPDRCLLDRRLATSAARCATVAPAGLDQ